VDKFQVFPELNEYNSKKSLYLISIQKYVMQLAAFSGEGGVATDGVKEMFLSYNITYNVGECRLVSLRLEIYTILFTGGNEYSLY
jgi:hypothetical protein